MSWKAFTILLFSSATGSSLKPQRLVLGCHMLVLSAGCGRRRRPATGLVGIFLKVFSAMFSTPLGRLTVCRANSMPTAPDHRDENQACLSFHFPVAVQRSHFPLILLSIVFNLSTASSCGFWFFFCLTFSVNLYLTSRHFSQNYGA